MKIFILFNHPAPYKVKLFNGLAQKHDLNVIFERLKNRDRNRLFYVDKEMKFNLHPISGIKIGNENHLSFGARRHLKAHKYDLIIINGYSTITEMLALRYLKRKNIPYAFYINGGVAKNESKLKTKIKRYFLKGAKYYFSPASAADQYLLKYGIKQEQIYHYPYSTIYQSQIKTSKISKDDKNLFWQSHNISGTSVFVTVTSFIRRKNNLELIKCWQTLPRSYTLVLIGEGKEKKKYLNYIKANGINNVIILPFMKNSEALEYVRHADGALYISRYDIYGHVINEALAMGVNVLASDRMVATKALIKDKYNGLVFDYKSPLKDKIVELLTYDFHEKAIETASKNTIEKMVERHLEIIEVNK